MTVTYNSAQHLRARWSGRDAAATEWIVVDNASGDDSVAVARELGARVIELSDNVGFAKANNIGLKETRTPWIAFVNPDVEVRTETLDRLSLLAGQHGALVAPQLTNPDGVIQPNGRGFPFLVDKFANRGLAIPGADLSRYTPDTTDGPTFVAWAIGAVVAGRRATFEALGGWNERYFLYYEDHDLGLRAWQAGHPVIVDPTVRWVHDWQRETAQFAISPWRKEFASAWTFFRTYPEFILPMRARALRRHARAGALVGRLVDLDG